MRIVPTAGQESYATITATVSGVANSTSYLLRGKITLTAVQGGTPNAHARRIVMVWSTGELTPVFEQTVPNSIGTFEYVAVVQTPASGTLTAIRVYNGDLATGKSVFWDDIMVGAGLDQTAPYFSGDTPSAGGDFQYTWSGAANDSTSIMSGTGVTTVVASTDAVPIFASSWAASGGHSLLIMATTVSQESYVSIGDGDAGAMRLGMLAGNSYTVQATLHLTSAQSGTLSDNARAILVGYKDSTGYHYIRSNQATNAAGDWFVRASFALPATTTEAFIRIYNGAALGKGDVWADEFLLVAVDDLAHTYLGDYFDGSTPDTDYADYEWTGTANASTSIIRGVAATAPVELTYRPAWL
jgi:hypothetical protein